MVIKKYIRDILVFHGFPSKLKYQALQGRIFESRFVYLFNELPMEKFMIADAVIVKLMKMY